MAVQNRHHQAPKISKCSKLLRIYGTLLHLFQSFSNILTLLQILFLRVLMPPVVEACTDQTYPMHPNASTCAFCGLISKSNLVLLHARLSLCIPSMRHAGQTTSRHPLLCRAIEHYWTWSNMIEHIGKIWQDQILLLHWSCSVSARCLTTFAIPPWSPTQLNHFTPFHTISHHFTQFHTISHHFTPFHTISLSLYVWLQYIICIWL